MKDAAETTAASVNASENARKDAAVMIAAVMTTTADFQ